MRMRKWSEREWARMVGQYPDLDGRPESVAFAVSCMDQGLAEGGAIRTRGLEFDIKVAGRALGSARDIAGLAPAGEAEFEVVTVWDQAAKVVGGATPAMDAALKVFQDLIGERIAVGMELEEVRNERDALAEQMDSLRAERDTLAERIETINAALA